MPALEFDSEGLLSGAQTWKCGPHELRATGRPLLMGIVNVTPDSFSDGGRFLAADAAVARGLELVEQGAEILDIGGESTRPGADIVGVDEELARVIPVIAGLSERTDVAISIDTTKAPVAEAAITAGATIVNDISGFRFDDSLIGVCAEHDVGLVCMHMQGTPQTMQQEPHYEDVVGEICEFFVERLAALEGAGIARERICLDPGVGFGKTAEHNVAILASIARFQELGCPVLIGHSRKRFLGKVLGRAVEERTAGTVGVSVALAEQGADVLRVHDVGAVRDAIVAYQAVMREVVR